MRYSKGLIFGHGYSDASHNDDPNNSRSVSSYPYVFAGGPVMWVSKTQTVVALSSWESKYIAPAYASQEAVYLSDLLSGITFPQFSKLTFPQFSSVQMY